MPDEKDFDLPKLNPLIELYPSDNDESGASRWTIYNPVSHSYFRIEWPEYECLSRFHLYKTAAQLQSVIAVETTLDIDIEDIQSLTMFLDQNDLLDVSSKKWSKKPKVSWWKKILQAYLFFTVPIVKPQKFLERTLAYVEPLISKTAVFFTFGLFLMAVFFTIPRADEFFNTFPELLNLEGLLLSLVLFFLIKICHELGHAYTAVHYGVSVNHMGIAMMVLYPVMYTEATGSWRLRESRKRMHIALAGFIAELYIATFFLFLWHFVPPGFWKTMSFLVVAITFVGSVFINLNPLMRFDGYYVLSDLLRYENMQARAMMFARWRIRKALFNLQEDLPEDIAAKHIRFLTFFGLAVLVYRFFLFLGIALMIYHIFFKPLGFLLMMIELWWFIGKPILNEFSVWWGMRAQLIKQRRAKVLLGLLSLMLLFLVLPTRQSIPLPAVHYAQIYQSFYPAVPAYVDRVHFKRGQFVKKGDVIAVLSSDYLDKKIVLMQAELNSLHSIKRKARFSKDRDEELTTIEDRIAQKELELRNTEKQKRRLIVIAPFSGVITDMQPYIHAGRYVQETDLLLRITHQGVNAYTGYVPEDQIHLLKEGQNATFFSSHTLSKTIALGLDEVSPVNIARLDWPQLGSIYNGPIAVDAVQSGEGRTAYVPRSGYYRVIFKEADKMSNSRNVPQVETGVIRVQTPSYSLAETYIKALFAFIRYELSLNT